MVHGLVMCGTTFTPGMVRQAFDFDGVDDRVQLPDSESLQLTESLSIEGWVMIRDYPADRSMILFRGDDRGGMDVDVRVPAAHAPRSGSEMGAPPARNEACAPSSTRSTSSRMWLAV